SGTLVTVDRRRRMVTGLEAKRRAATRTSSHLRREINSQVKQLSEAVDIALRDSITHLQSVIEHTFIDFGRTDTDIVEEKALRSIQTEWESRIDESASETQDRLEALREQLVSVAEAISRNESVTETTALLESRVESYRDELDSYAELAQVGMALGIVQHEF